MPLILKFDVIAISKTTKNEFPINNIDLKNYS